MCFDGPHAVDTPPYVTLRVFSLHSIFAFQAPILICAVRIQLACLKILKHELVLSLHFAKLHHSFSMPWSQPSVYSLQVPQHAITQKDVFSLFSHFPYAHTLLSSVILTAPPFVSLIKFMPPSINAFLLLVFLPLLSAIQWITIFLDLSSPFPISLGLFHVPIFLQSNVSVLKMLHELQFFPPLSFLTPIILLILALLLSLQPISLLILQLLWLLQLAVLLFLRLLSF